MPYCAEARCKDWILLYICTVGRKIMNPFVCSIQRSTKNQPIKIYFTYSSIFCRIPFKVSYSLQGCSIECADLVEDESCTESHTLYRTRNFWSSKIFDSLMEASFPKIRNLRFISGFRAGHRNTSILFVFCNSFTLLARCGMHPSFR